MNTENTYRSFGDNKYTPYFKRWLKAKELTEKKKVCGCSHSWQCNCRHCDDKHFPVNYFTNVARVRFN